jgi:peptidoglycan/xylan/chitin deacetylase (PgdA/CDA1 family)
MDLSRQSRAALLTALRRLAAALAWAGCAAAGAHAAEPTYTIAPGQRFVAVAFHDVVDYPGDRDGDAVTVDRLIGFFEWLRGNGWTAITLDDVAAAARGRPLPEKAILLTFDDGYRSLYTRVFPLALAYRMPVVAALVGSWLDAPLDGKVRYGDVEVPRRDFISWDEARVMAASGLVEFASHGFDLHRGVRANPQGNLIAAAATLAWSQDAGYESAAEFRRRIAADLERSRAQMARELGRAPRAIVWPFGRYNAAALEAAGELGFEFALTLDPEPADASRPTALARYLPTRDPTLRTIASALRFEDVLPAARRLVCVDPAALWTADPAATDEWLGRAIERLRTLGASAVVIDAAVADGGGRLTGAWFPTRELPLAGDFLSRVTWQMQSRAGVTAYARLPLAAAARTLGDPARVRALARDLGAHAAIAGLFLDDVPGLVARTQPAGSGAPWEVRRRRDAVGAAGLDALEALALEAFRAVERERPGLRLALVAPPEAPPAPSAIADLTLFPARADAASAAEAAARLGRAGALAPSVARRVGLWFASAGPPGAADLAAATRRFQVAGGTGIGWCRDDPLADRPAAARAGPSVSSATFPVKF